MATNIITSEDLEQFKWEFLELTKEHIDKRLGKITPAAKERQWLKSHQVQRMTLEEELELVFRRSNLFNSIAFQNNKKSMSETHGFLNYLFFKCLRNFVNVPRVTSRMFGTTLRLHERRSLF